MTRRDLALMQCWFLMLMIPSGMLFSPGSCFGLPCPWKIESPSWKGSLGMFLAKGRKRETHAKTTSKEDEFHGSRTHSGRPSAWLLGTFSLRLHYLLQMFYLENLVKVLLKGKKIQDTPVSFVPLLWNQVSSASLRFLCSEETAWGKRVFRLLPSVS